MVLDRFGHELADRPQLYPLFSDWLNPIRLAGLGNQLPDGLIELAIANHRLARQSRDTARLPALC